MSANNYILINQDNLEVSVNDAGTGNSFGKPQKARNLENAIEIAQKIQNENIIEYGITFTKNKTSKKRVKNKIYLYIDGTNLLAGLVEMFGFGKVPSFASILKIIKKYYKYNQIYFYASYTSLKGITKLPKEKQEKVKKQIGLEIKYFKKVRNIKNLVFYQGYRSPTSKKEKGVDVHLAVDMVKDAFLKNCNQAIIFSGDADFEYPVEILKELSIPVYAIFIPNRFSLAIAYKCIIPTVLNYNNLFINKRKINKLRIIKIAQKRPRSKRAR
ncbi:MAG: NYN domain-containing protein [Candidatus Woesebacteria bacterium]|nr:NYN domain-containing protein [Candidatus Woesebacteria bacterium]